MAGTPGKKATVKRKGPNLRAVPSGGSASGSSGGRPPHEPTDQTRMMVKMGKCCLMTEEQIAGVLDISRNTLRKHYRHELDHGAGEIRIRVRSNLVAIACDRNHPKVVSAGIWIEKSTYGMTDGDRRGDVDDDDLQEFTISIGDRKSSNG